LWHILWFRICFLDDNKCPTCKCITKPTVCPAIACATCLYGNTLDSVGCPTCNCNPCSTSEICSRACLYGFAKSAFGCQTCTCNDAPVCPTTANTDPSTCPLDCTKGLTLDSGCTYCKCATTEVCKCDPIPTDYKPIPCDDRVSYIKYTGVCARNEKGICENIFTRCPIGITVTVKTELTNEELTAIKTSLGVTNDNDYTVAKNNTSGGVTYTIWVQKDGIPSTFTPEKVQSTADAKAKEFDPNAVTQLISEGAAMTPSFGHILAPFIGLLLSVVILFF